MAQFPTSTDCYILNSRTALTRAPILLRLIAGFQGEICQNRDQRFCFLVYVMPYVFLVFGRDLVIPKRIAKVFCQGSSGL